MCIMAGPVESVSNTRIFVGADSRGLRQVVLYAMAVQLQARSGKGNAMILPVPGGATDVALFDLTAYPTIFDDIDAPFVVRSRGVSKDLDRSFGEPLEVHRVGSYDVSIVPTVDDVKRLNTSVFEVSADTENTLRGHYPVGFAFLVAQLRTSGDFHPLAYTHPVVDGRMFIPTRHEHGGRSGDLPKWDHSIYHQSQSELDVIPQDHRNIPRRQTARTAHFDGKLLPLLYASEKTRPLVGYFDPRGPLTKIEAHGRLPNIDLTVHV